MQTGTANFGPAASASTVAWLPPQVFADWAANGYGAADSIDDLSGQSANVAISHALDDGLPAEVSFATDDPVPTMSCDLSGRGEVTGARYFSPFRTDSPVYGYDRDVAPVKVDHGLVTTAGRERIRVFTGQMADVPVNAGQATMKAISATRLALADLVQPPVVVAEYAGDPWGLTATWPVSYTLHACGIYPSPPAMTGCCLWLPMHGGGNMYLPAANTVHGLGCMSGVELAAGETTSVIAVPRTIRGPFVGAGYASSTADLFVGQQGSRVGGARVVADNDWLSTAGSRGRVQFYVRGDAAATNLAPGGSATFELDVPGIRMLAGLQTSSFVTTPYAVGGIDLNRKPFVTVFDGTHTATLTASAALPTDGAWHMVGAAWDVANNKLWTYMDGTLTTSTPSPALSTAGLPATMGEGEAAAAVSLAFALPFAEVQFSSGPGASPTVTPAWLDTLVWTQRADVYPSSLGMVAVAEPQPREAWEYLAALAQSDMSALRIDENDMVRYWPRGYFATVAGQTEAETVTTQTAAALPDVQLDRSRIRNIARVTYQQTSVDDYFSRSPILEYKTTLPVPPGVTVYAFALDTPAVFVFDSSFGSFTHLTANQILGVDPFTAGDNYVTLNTSADGLGAYSTASDVDVTMLSWTAGEVVVQFTNRSGLTWYLTNSSGSATTQFAYLSVQGQAIRSTDASVTEQYDASVDVRGPRVLVVDLPLVQSAVEAERVARRIVGDLAFPQAVIPQVEVFGDPRRQPGDLVAFVDDAQTGIDGQFRSWSVRHRINGADYRQTLRLQQARAVGTWGDGVSRWGRVVWAGQEVNA